MTPERWQQIKTILDGALEQDPAERDAFVATECDGDGALAAEVGSFLAAESDLGDFIEEPVFDLHAGKPEPSLVGERLGAYRVTSEIGHGGMGAVYLAERADTEFEKRVAIKLLKRGLDTDEIVRRFRSERQILARLEHPNIAQLLDGGTTADGRPYLVMEYVEGQPIDQYCDARKLSVRERLELFRTVSMAVHFAHQNLVVHRDLKPGNIVIGADGAPKLLDFGIAKLLAEDSPDATVVAGFKPMTLAYASPEQVAGEPITTGSDVYSLGVLLYRLLTGRSPYGEPTPTGAALERAVREREPERPSRVAGPEQRRQLEGDLDNVVLMALRKDPQRRYASADQLAGDIERHLKGFPVIARKDTVAYRTGKFVRRHKLSVSLAAAVLLLIVGSMVSMRILLRKAVQERGRAEFVSSFLEELFATSDPGASRGETVTARELLDRGRKKLASEFKGQTVLKADLSATMGRSYRNLGLYDPAKGLLEESLRLRLANFGDNSLPVAESLHNLALVWRKLGDDARAERLMRRALDIQVRHHEDGLEYAKGLNNLAALLEAKGEYTEAESLFDESLKIKRRLLGDNHPDVARVLNNLAHLFQTQGDYRRAESLYRQALVIRRKFYGEAPHPDVAMSLNTLASLLSDVGDDRAEEMYREALAMRRKLNSEPHPDVARTLNNLAFLLLARGDLRGAEPLFREALSIYDQVGNVDPRERAVVLRNLAALHLAEGDPHSAEPMIREALAVFRERGKPPWRIADAESVLGGCLAARGRSAEAEPLLSRSYQVLDADPGDGKKYARQALERLVKLYDSWGKASLAEEYRARLRG